MKDGFHPIVAAAGERGELPEWARCGLERRGHAERVARLMGQWAAANGASEKERVRWRAVGLLHDALRDARSEELRRLTDAPWPVHLLHAPACAARLRDAGVGDEELLQAVEYHSIGHRNFGDLGEYLYLADFLEPGREFLREERASLRARLPAERRDVLATVIALRMKRVLDKKRAMLPESVHFWNRVVGS
ncbi:MAG: HD domain-containing protein [Gemmatimonadota bacterium]